MTHGHGNFLVALAGQPNVGKSTIFNMLTGASQHVANFPGVTVDKKQGHYHDGEHRFEIVDLPGTYSLTSYTQEERIARDFILLERPEVVVVVIDASNLERNLYFALQLREMEVPLVLCLNMMDVAERRGMEIDAEALAKSMNVPVVPVVGKSNKGRQELGKAILDTCMSANHAAPEWKLDYGPGLEPVLEKLTERLREHEHLMEDFSPRWLAVKLMENDAESRRIILHHTHDQKEKELVDHIEKVRAEFVESTSGSPQKIIATARYHAATAIVETCLTRSRSAARTFTDRADALLLHRGLGPILLAVIIFIFYQITMNLGTKLSDLTQPVMDTIAGHLHALFPNTDALRMGMIESLLVEGVFGALATLLYFVPLFFVLFSMLAILEDTGYMARIAFILDRVFRAFGLQGQSTLPLILGGVVAGGCAVPGVLATRAMRDEKARLLTILVMPLMNCAAKIPIFAMIIATWVGAGYLAPGISKRGLAMFALSMMTFFSAMIIAKLFSRYLVKGKNAPFILELPNYHMPTARGVLRRAWQRIWSFFKKLFTVIILIQIVMWFLVTFPGIGDKREAQYDQKLQAATEELLSSAPAESRLGKRLHDPQDRIVLLEDYRKARASFEDQGAEPGERPGVLPAVDPDAFVLANLGVGSQGDEERDLAAIAKAFGSYAETVTELNHERRREVLKGSIAGRVGRFAEPFTRLAGFDWRMNIAIFSSFAARENLVGTLGTIYNIEFTGDGSMVEFIRSFAPNWTGWNTIALLVFVAFLPPCIPTVLTVKAETGRNKWAVLTAVYPLVIGFILAVLILQLSRLLLS